VFISFEGIDKSGKSTQVSLLADFLLKKNYPIAVTKEPGGTDLGKLIKNLLLMEDKKINPFAELFLYLADRAQHVQEVIVPLLKEEKLIISDRYADATLAYQGFGRGLSFEMIQKLNDKVTQGIWPNLTFLLDIEPELAMRRKRANDRIEKEDLIFHRKVREGYLKIAKLCLERIKVIKADESPLFIHEKIKKITLEKLSHGV